MEQKIKMKQLASTQKCQNVDSFLYIVFYGLVIHYNHVPQKIKN